MHIDFEDISYLKQGTFRQQKAFHALTIHHIMKKLHQFHPLLAGTIPLNIDTANSDLDILCEWTTPTVFINHLQNVFGQCENFMLCTAFIRGNESVICNFTLEGFQFEIFGQAIPTTEQMAYRHMLIEHRLLLEHGDEFRKKVITLKEQGIKTEQAFAILLNLCGDPYTALLQLDK